MRIIPSIFGYEPESISYNLRQLCELGVDTFHVDVMDGSISQPKYNGFEYLCQLKILLRDYNIKINVHLITENPYDYIETIINHGVDEVSADMHLGSKERQKEFINTLRSHNIKVGLVYNNIWHNNTDVLDIDYLHICGSNFKTGRVLMANEIINIIRTSPFSNIPIMVDGGVGLHNIKAYRDAGATIFVSGKGIFEGDVVSNYQQMQKLIG